jgi:hypothetical protein
MVNIPAIFEELVDKVSEKIGTPVYFFHGSRKELVAHLQLLGQGVTTKDKKYPVFWLVYPFTKRFGGDHLEYCELPDLMIYIATYTIPNSSTAQRMTDNFFPVLYPIYEGFLYQLDETDKITWQGGDIPHDVIDWPFWGEPEGKQDANPLNDTVDAVLIRNLKLIVNLDLCGSVPSGKLIG